LHDEPTLEASALVRGQTMHGAIGDAGPRAREGVDLAGLVLRELRDPRGRARPAADHAVEACLLLGLHASGLGSAARVAFRELVDEGRGRGANVIALLLTGLRRIRALLELRRRGLELLLARVRVGVLGASGKGDRHRGEEER
jgi:hypothetical protein